MKVCLSQLRWWIYLQVAGGCPWGSRYAEAKLIVLRDTDGEPKPGLWKIVAPVEDWSRQEMEKIGYPDPSCEHYAVFEIEPVAACEGIVWDKDGLARIGEERRPQEVSRNSPYQLSLKELSAVQVP